MKRKLTVSSKNHYLQCPKSNLCETITNYNKAVILREKIKALARLHGFDLIGFIDKFHLTCSAKPWSIDKRVQNNPFTPGSVVIVGMYDIKLIKESNHLCSTGKIARSYAVGHEFDLNVELQPIIDFLINEGYQAHPVKKYFSTNFSLKKSALFAGLGWQGYNSLIINPTFGSWITYGAIITSAELETEDQPQRTRCGKCMKCIRACPMQAIIKPFVVQPKRCLDKILNTPGAIPDSTKTKIGNRLLSCDICQEVCPYNRQHIKYDGIPRLYPYQFTLSDLLSMDKELFNGSFGKLNWSIDFHTFLRNVIIASGNSGDGRLILKLKNYMAHENEPIKDAVKWALRKLNYHSFNS